MDPRFQAMMNGIAGKLRSLETETQGQKEELAEQRKSLVGLATALSRVSVGTAAGDPNIQRVENIPGRRIPFTLVVDLPVRGDQTGVIEATFPIPQHGPFVAVRRGATFISDFQFRVLNDDGTTNDFFGRSNGRLRPIHSVWDLNDGQPISQTLLDTPPAFPGAGLPHYISPSNASPFRTMQPDFRISFDVAGDAIPRQNDGLPSSFYAKGLSDPWDLPCLDFFARNSVLRWRVTPLHPTNAEFGNVQNYATPPPFPFLSSQYDHVEGIIDNARLDGQGDNFTVDPVTRVPDGILVMMLDGYLIWQPPGAGPT